MKKALKNRLRSNRRGFTLVEILIVVVILGILAAIVIPQFSSASGDARLSNLKSQLQTIREQIALYKLQHNNALPSLVTRNDWLQLTEYTDSSGNPQTTYDATHCYGPYLSAAPINPFAPSATATVVAADATSSPGWVYDEAGTGKFYATGTASSSAYYDDAAGADTANRPW